MLGNKLIHIIILMALSTIVFYLNVYFISGSSIKNPDLLAFELVGNDKKLSPDVWINNWTWNQDSIS